MFLAKAFRGPLTVSLAYVAVYYALQVNQLVVKGRLRRAYKSRGERFDRYFGQDPAMLAADRYAGNMLDHMAPFLLLLWLHAIFVGSTTATIAGGVYVAARVSYPFAMGRQLKGGVPRRIMLATAPGYAVLAYFFLSLLLELF